MIIPQANVATLMLDERVLQAVRNGQFHVYAVRQADEALSLLVGEDAGSPDEKGRFPRAASTPGWSSACARSPRWAWRRKRSPTPPGGGRRPGEGAGTGQAPRKGPKKEPGKKTPPDDKVQGPA